MTQFYPPKTISRLLALVALVLFTQFSFAQVDGGSIALRSGAVDTTVIIDGMPDLIVPVLDGTAMGTELTFVITDAATGNILAIPPTNGPFDLDPAGTGVCGVWYLAYEPGIMGLAVGSPLMGLSGTFDLSNSISVTRVNTPDGGSIALRSGAVDTTVTVDGTPDLILPVLDGTAVGTEMTFVITDAATATILAIPPTNGPFDLDPAGLGVCDVYYLAYEPGIMGLATGSDINNLSGLFDLSNPIAVTRVASPDGGSIALRSGAVDTTVTVDGTPDLILPVLDGTAVGTEMTFVITDAATGTILAIPPTNGPFDLDPAGAGVCDVYYLAYEPGITGLATGSDINNLSGLFDLSNPIAVTRVATLDGGSIALRSGAVDTTVTIDGLPDLILPVLDGTAVGTERTFVITDAATGNILAIPMNNGPFDLEGAGVGVCDVYYLAYEPGIMGLAAGNNIDDLSGLFDLSNPIVVTRVLTPEGGSIALRSGAVDTTVTIDGLPDLILPVRDGMAVGTEMTFVITDAASGNILAIPPTNGPFDLEGAGAGVCDIYYLSYEPGIMGLMMGSNIDDLSGLFDLSNPIVVTRVSAPVDGIFTARLGGLQENPSVLTAGRGLVTATLRGNLLSFEGDFSQLDDDFDASIAGGAHVHTAIAGKNGPITFLLTTDVDGDLRGGSFAAADNTFTLDASQLASLEANALYINIHTLGQPSGEIRGQVLPSAAEYYQATLLGSSQVPSIVSRGDGNVLFTLDNNILTVTGSFENLSDTVATDLAGGAHLHFGYAGQSGPVTIPINLTLDADRMGAAIEASNNTFTLDADQLNALMNDSLYLNVHSGAFRGGEIRGQISRLNVATFRGQLTGQQELPAVNVNSTGRIHLSLDENNMMRVSGSFTNLSSDLATDISGGVHIHVGTSGLTGPIEYIITPTLDATGRNAVFNPSLNTFDVSDREDELFDRELYVNVHSQNFREGELRGQLLPLAQTYLGADMSGFNEVESAFTFGRGNWQFELTDNVLTLSGGFFDLISDYDPSIGTHLHYGTAIENGPIALVLNPRVDASLRSGSFPTDDNRFTISDGLRDSLLSGQIYVNLHTLRHPTGELRSQLLRDDNNFPVGGNNIFSPTVGDTIVLEDDASMTLDVTAMNITDPDGDLLVYNYQLSTTFDFSGVFYSKKVLDIEPGQFNAAEIYQAAIDTGFVFLTPRTIYQRLAISDGAVSLFSSRDSLTLTLLPNIPSVGGDISLVSGGTDTLICIDGVASPIEVVLAGNATGTNFSFVITDDAGEILALPPGNGPFDLEGAGVGTCQIYHVASEIDFMGAAVGNNIADFTGTFGLSNPITVYRQAPDGGAVTLLSGATDTTIVLGVGTFDVQHTTASDRLDFIYVITNDQDMILGAVNSATSSTIDVNGAGVGTCRIYGYSATDLPMPVVGQPLSSLTDDPCEAISGSFISVTREMPSSTQEFDADTRIDVFPNPAKDFVQVKIEQPNSDRTSVSLYSMTGQLIETTQGDAQAFNVSFALNTLPAGTYTIVIRRGDQVAVRNVVKE